MRIAVCDDNKKELETVCSMLSRYSAENSSAGFSVRAFSSSYELAECIGANHDFSLYLLDVIMPDINGIALGELIRRYDQNAVIVYLTTSRDFAVESYSVQAFHYLLKPFSKEQFFAVLDRALSYMEHTLIKSLPVKTAGGTAIVALRRIMYAEYRNHCVLYYMEDRTEIKSMTMRKSFEKIMEPILCDKYFIKISTAYVVNMQYVKMITKNGFIMQDDRELSISRNIYGAVKNHFIDFLLGKGGTGNAV